MKRLCLSLLLLTFALPTFADECEEIAARAQEILPMLSADFTLVPPITDREFWTAVARHPNFAKQVQTAEKLLETPISQVPDELYLEYSQNGNRTNYQTEIGRRNAPLRQLVYAECIENQGRFLPRIEEFLRVYASDRSWVLPAHDRSLTNFNGTNHIDLASSATSWELALLGQILGDRLSPEARKVLDEQLELRCFQPFRSCILTGTPKMWWVRGKNNWNAVCLAGVTGAALANLKSPEERAWFVAAAEKFIQNSTDGYTSDGYCSEGVGYWCYGFGHQVALAELLCRATGGELRLLDELKLRRVAWYGFQIEILPGKVPSFADCSMNARPNAVLCALLNRYYHFGVDCYDEALGLANRSLPDFGIYSCRPEEMGAKPDPGADSAAETVGIRTWFEEAQALICRPNGFEKARGNLANNRATEEATAALDGLAVAMKGGHNAELHNHNDVGAYVVLHRGTRPALDLGGEVYTRRTFSKDRYVSDLLNSWGHNVPVVAGKLQSTGRDACTGDLTTSFSEAREVLSFDFQRAYPVPELEKLTRTFTYDRTGGTAFSVEDAVVFSTPQTFETAMVTIEAWKREGNRVILGTDDAAVVAEIEVRVEGQVSEDWTLTESTYESDFRAKPSARRLGIVLNAPVKNATVRVTYRPQ